MKKPALILVAGMVTALFSQRISKDVTDYEFIQLPQKPLPATVDGYTTKVNLKYLDKIAEKKAAYERDLAAEEADFQQKLAQWEVDKKNAQANYDRDMKAYNDQSGGKRILTELLSEESTKPVLQMPPRPVRVSKVEAPFFSKEYSSSLLESKYGTLAGYEKGGSAPVAIEIDLHGFEVIGPDLVVSTTKKKNKDGSSYDVYSYSYSFSYKHPVSVKLSHNGEVLAEETPESAVEFKSVKSNTYKSEYDLKQWWRNSRDSYLGSLDDKVTHENLAAAQELINNSFGFPQIKRNTIVRIPSHNKQSYTDYVDAYSYAVAGYNALEGDLKREESIEKLTKAVEIWETALTEAQPTERNVKKARVNDEVTIATYLNLVEAAILMHDYDKADMLIVKMGTLKLKNKEERMVKSLREFMKDQKQRFKVNKS